MRVYFKKNGMENVVIFINHGAHAKMATRTPSGIFEGVNVSAENAEEQLRAFLSMYGKYIRFQHDLDWCDDCGIAKALDMSEEMDLIYDGEDADAMTMHRVFEVCAYALNEQIESEEKVLERIHDSSIENRVARLSEAKEAIEDMLYTDRLWHLLGQFS